MAVGGGGPDGCDVDWKGAATCPIAILILGLGATSASVLEDELHRLRRLPPPHLFLTPSSSSSPSLSHLLTLSFSLLVFIFSLIALASITYSVFHGFYGSPSSSSPTVGSETTTSNSNEVEEELGGDLGRDDEVLERESEVGQVEEARAGFLEMMRSHLPRITLGTHLSAAAFCSWPPAHRRSFLRRVSS